MKRTQWIEFFKRIRRSLVSFIAILVFVTFGVGLFLGIRWSAPAFYKSMEADYDELKLRDIELVFASGLSDEGLKELGDLPEVSEIEGIYTAYQYFCYDGIQYQAKIGTVTEDVDMLRVKSGRLPETDSEIAVESSWASWHDLSIGDTVVLNHDGDSNAHFVNDILNVGKPDMDFANEDGMQYFLNDTFTVTALVDSPTALSTLAPSYEASPVNPSPVGVLFFVPREAFDSEAFPGYTGALIRSDSLRLMCTTDEEYRSSSDALAEKLRPTVERLGEEQKDRISDALEKFSAFSMGSSYQDIYEPGSTTAILTRSSRGSIVMTGIIGDLMKKLCSSFGIVFVVIGILVCYSTLSRIVYQETVLSGTKKALGFFDREVLCSFLCYGVLMSLAGVILGTLMAVFVVQPLLLGIIGKTYLFSKLHTSFLLKEAVMIFLVETAVMIIAAFVACAKTLKRSTVSLLAGSEPPSGKERLIERSRYFNRMPLLTKCIIQNFFNDRRRVIATIIGIVGCMSLIVSSITFEYSATKSMDRQYSTLQHFDTIVYFDPDNAESSEKIEEVLKEKIETIDFAMAFRSALITEDGANVVTDIFVGDDLDREMMEFYDTKGNPIDSPEGVLLSCAYGKYYGIEPGDKVICRSRNNTERSLTVGGVFEYYIQIQRLVMSSEEYESFSGEHYAANACLFNKGNLTVGEIDDMLSGIDGYIYTKDFYRSTMSAQSVINLVITAVMILYLALSVIIALFVVLDILLMFVSEKKREIITLIINGYSIKYARKYISADTIFLTVIGIIGGLAAGILLGAWDIRTMESDSCYFLHGINFTACILGAVFTVLLVVIMTAIALKKIDHFDLSDINEV